MTCTCTDDDRCSACLLPAPPAPAVPVTAPDETLRRFADAETLRDHLDALNDSGTNPTVAGVTSSGFPFLITLQGPYAETEAVLYGVPWDGEIDWNTPRRCDECGCREAFGIESLGYPVTVFAALAADRTPPAGDEGGAK